MVRGWYRAWLEGGGEWEWREKRRRHERQRKEGRKGTSLTKVWDKNV